MTSWKAEVIADGSGVWVANALRFATKREALDYVDDLSMRWTAVRQSRAKRCSNLINARFVDFHVEHGVCVLPFAQVWAQIGIGVAVVVALGEARRGCDAYIMGDSPASVVATSLGKVIDYLEYLKGVGDQIGV